MPLCSSKSHLSARTYSSCAEAALMSACLSVLVTIRTRDAARPTRTARSAAAAVLAALAFNVRPATALILLPLLHV